MWTGNKVLEELKEEFSTSSGNNSENEKRVFLKWENLNYTVNENGKLNKVLKGVSGFANPGEILAVMGSSGSGKTSLLSILSNKIFTQRNVKISGSIEVNGVNIKKSTIQIL